LLEDLDRALGRVPDVRRAHVPRQRYSTGLELDHEITAVPRLVRTLEPLLLTMGDFLRKRQCCLRGFELRLQHRSIPATRIVVRLVAPATEAVHFIELVSARLERIVLPAPVHHVRLRSGALIPIDAAMMAMADAFTGACDHIDPVAGASLARRREPTRVPRLVERLRARLGVEAVHGLCLVPEHRPESASKVAEPRVRPSGRSPRGRSLRPSGRAPQTRIEPGTPRPLWLLCEPQPLAVEHERPCCDGPLVLEQGPERIESGWWDGADVARDYYVARTPTGLMLWIYRERRAGRRWFLHGVFA
jgi:protein ImuB